MFYMFPRIVKPEVCNKIIEDCVANDLEIAKVHDGDNSSSRDDPEHSKKLLKLNSCFPLLSDNANKLNLILLYLSKFFK